MNYNALVADDNKVMRDLMKFYLKRIGNLDVLEAQDGLEALKVMKSVEVDFLFLDIRMPQLDGFNVANYLKAQSSQTMIVAISGDLDERNRTIFKQLGVKYFLKKPIDPRACSDIIKKLIEIKNHQLEAKTL